MLMSDWVRFEYADTSTLHVAAGDQARCYPAAAHSGNPDNWVEVAHLPGGAVAVRDSKDQGREPLRVTVGEWDAFVRMPPAGEF